MTPIRPIADEVVLLRPPTLADASTLVEGRDEVSHRFLGEGDPDPRPTAVIIVDGAVVGWVDYDTDRSWLAAGEVNVGYNVFAPHRGNGYASRAVKLLMSHLDADTEWETATLLIDPDNEGSLALAGRLGFTAAGAVDGELFWKQPVAAFSGYGGLAG